jgi:uncharacterized protein YejL (UPF0352 family)
VLVVLVFQLAMVLLVRAAAVRRVVAAMAILQIVFQLVEVVVAHLAAVELVVVVLLVMLAEVLEAAVAVAVRQVIQTGRVAQEPQVL